MIEYIKSSNIIVKLLLILFVSLLYHSILIGTSYYTLVFCIWSLFVVPVRRHFDGLALSLIVFSVLYSLMHLVLGISSSHIPLYLMAPLLFYTFGCYITSRLYYRSSILEFIALTVFLFSIVTYYTCIIDVTNTGLVNPLRIMGRNGGDEYDMAATLYGLNVSLGLACLFGFLSIEKKERTLLHYLLPISFALSLLTTVHLVNRTGLVLVCFSLFVFLFYSKKSSKATWIILIFVAALFAYLSTKSDFASIIDAYTSRGEVEGHGLSDAGSRTEKWMDALSRLFTSPFGWYKDINYTFTHNMWLDVARLTGFIPFIAIVCATIVGFKDTLHLYRIKNDYLVLTLISIQIVFFLGCFVEPVMEGFDLYFYLMCMFFGIQRQYIKQISKSKCYN